MIEIRAAKPHEEALGCNTCASEAPVEVVMETGSRNSTYLTRLCKDCFIQLQHVTNEVAGWDVFRDEW